MEANIVVVAGLIQWVSPMTVRGQGAAVLDDLMWGGWLKMG